MKIALMPWMVLVCVMLVPENSTGFVSTVSAIKSEVEFSIYNAGLEIKGTIGGIRAAISFNPADLAHSSIHAIADPATLQTGITIRDKHLQRSDYFDVRNYPQIHIVSKGFRKTGKNKFTGRFSLTIKDINKEITIPFVVLEKQHSTIYKGNFKINRLDFNLGEKSAILDEKVEIFITVNMQK